MSYQVGKRSQLAKAIGFAVAALLASAIPVHAESSSASGQSANAPNTASQNISAAGAMAAGNQQESSRQNSDPKNRLDNFGGASNSAGATSSGSSNMSSGKSSSGSSSSSENMSFTAGSVSKNDRNMIRQLATANMAEIEAAQMAKSKTGSEQVRTFAQQMIDDHTQVGTQIQQLAEAKKVHLPTQPTAAQRAEAKKLAALSGDAFDKQYLSRAGVSDHRKAEQLVKRISAQAKDSELKEFASNLVPSFQKHLDLAQQSVGKAGQSSGGTSVPSTSGSSSNMDNSRNTQPGAQGMPSSKSNDASGASDMPATKPNTPGSAR